MAIKHFNDSGRYMLIIEPVDDEALKLIAKIKEVCGLTDDKPVEIEGLTPPAIPSKRQTSQPVTEAKTTPAPSGFDIDESKVGAGYKAFLSAMLELKSGKLDKEAKQASLDKTKRFISSMKEKIPSGENLKYCIAHLSEMFSEKIENLMLEDLKISKKQLELADAATLTEAYKVAMSKVELK